MDQGVVALRVDLTTDAGPTRLAEAAVDLGSIDILVNNVGAVTPRIEGFLMITDDQWQTTLALNLMTTVRCIRAALPDPGVMDYSAAKALSKEVGPHGVRVNTVSPGPVATPLWLGDRGVASQAASESLTGRFTQPREVAELIAFLASDTLAGNITGADFVVDGGLSTETH